MRHAARPKSGKSPAADAVTVGYVHDIEVAYSWHASYMGLIQHDLATRQRVIRGGHMGVRYGTGGIVEARNIVARAFMQSRRADWLFWVDTDMGFAPDTVDRLMAAADPVERPVVGGLCFANREMGLDGMGGHVTQPLPTIYFWAEQDGQQGFQAAADFERDSVVRCSGTGSACLLVHRSVFERIHERYGDQWYQPIPNPSLGPGSMISEDLAFCMRAQAVGVPIHVHTGVLTTHLKPVWLGLPHHEAHRAITAG